MTSIITLFKIGENLDFFTPKMLFLSISISCDNIEYNTRAPVLLNFSNSLRKRDKILGKPRIYLFFLTHIINSIKHEHSCKIPYIQYGSQKNNKRAQVALERSPEFLALEALFKQNGLI